MADDGCESLTIRFFDFVQTGVQTIFCDALTKVPKPLPFMQLGLGLLETPTGLKIRVSAVRARP